MDGSSATRGAPPSIPTLVGPLLVAGSFAHAQGSPRFAEIFENLTWRPGQLAEPLSTAALVGLDEAIDALPSRLPDADLRVVARRPGDPLRIGAKHVPVPEAASWRHFEGSPRLWIHALGSDGDLAGMWPVSVRQAPIG